MRVYFLIAVLSTILAVPSLSRACSCNGNPAGNPACQAFWYTDVVFSGKVVDIKGDGKFGSGNPGEENHVSFTVDEAFKGIAGKRALISTAQESSMCGYPFKIGEPYLVYARKDKDGKLSVGLCGRTIPLSAAAEDIAYFKSLSTAKPLGSISGIVFDLSPPKGNEPRTGPPRMPDIKVTAQGETKKYEAVTDGAGQYHLTDLEPGDYAVNIFAPAGFSPLITEHKIKVFAKRCSVFADVFSKEKGDSIGIPGK